ncbi:MAG TPA: LacI family DNA-binding transcriptional regulator [Phycisphaerales bacterium]|nr:LacI family DNA-binding transcriptional regulator [Phycisphaerales bacterium]
MPADHRTSDVPPARKSGGPVSIQDVADAAQVSIATVSRVINGHQLVASETAARVKAAIERLGFKPNRFAQGLMTRRSKLLGLAVPDLYGEFYSTILRSADAAARKAGYHLLVSTFAGRSSQAGEEGLGGDNLLASLPLSLLDGMAVMITEPNRRAVEAIRAMSVPVVVVDLEAAATQMDTVLVDNVTGAREATEHLLNGTPPERIRFVGGPESNFDTAQRSRAVADALARRGAALKPSQVRFGDYSLEWGRQWAHEAEKAGELRNAGVLAGNDEIAWGIMLAAQELGISIPGELRIVGFDDTRLSTLTRPRLSTVHMPLAQIGSSALELLARRIADPAAPPETVRLSTSLVQRESS